MSAAATAVKAEPAWRSGTPETVAAAIRDAKRAIKVSLGDPRKVFGEVDEAMKREVDEVHETFRRDGSAVPCVDYAAIRDGRVPDATRALIRRRGTAVVRGVFPRAK